jgi:hypothetical protein
MAEQTEPIQPEWLTPQQWVSVDRLFSRLEEIKKDLTKRRATAQEANDGNS